MLFKRTYMITYTLLRREEEGVRAEEVVASGWSVQTVHRWTDPVELVRAYELEVRGRERTDDALLFFRLDSLERVA